MNSLHCRFHNIFQNYIPINDLHILLYFLKRGGGGGSQGIINFERRQIKKKCDLRKNVYTKINLKINQLVDL